MRLLFWTHLPSTASVRHAFKNARKARFLDGQANSELIRKSTQLLLDVKRFVPTAFNEMWVNLRGGLMAKRRDFESRLKSAAARSAPTGVDAPGVALETLGTGYRLRGRADLLAGVLKAGEPVLVVANHPYAPIDGRLLLSMVHQHRNDCSVMVNANNGLIAVCPQYRPRLIPVDLSEGLLRSADLEAVRRSRLRAIRHGLRRLQTDGECLILFPAGSVSKANAWGDEIVDAPWLDGVGFLVRRFASTGKRLTVLPIYVDTHMGGAENSQRFQEAHIEAPTHLPAALMKAFFNPPASVDLHIGEPLPAAAFGDMTDSEIASFLRKKVYEHATIVPRALRQRRTRPELVGVPSRLTDRHE